MRIFLITLMAAAMAFAGAEDDVKKAEQAWADGITKNDFAVLNTVLADDLHYLHSTGLVDSKAAYIESMKSGKQKYISVKYGQMKVRVYGSAAVVNADAMVAYTTDGKGGTNHLAFTHVFAKKGGKWQLVSHQSLRLEK
ncbi:MAG: nuclear transport factor 2 family protein [Acidobacteria bacterium]|nr:nuclear transport factor 2 family protein [Acidobacteriota bacterium]